MKLGVSVLALALAIPGSLPAQETSLAETDKNFSEAPTTDKWIYNDLEKGIAEAKTAGKPLMVVYRCIP